MYILCNEKCYILLCLFFMCLFSIFRDFPSVPCAVLCCVLLCVSLHLECSYVGLCGFYHSQTEKKNIEIPFHNIKKTPFLFCETENCEKGVGGGRGGRWKGLWGVWGRWRRSMCVASRIQVAEKGFQYSQLYY